MRFDRMSHGDTLSDSTKRLVDFTASLKKNGYKQVVLAGQSFGAFLSLMAADSSADVDGVIATAPAAYGSWELYASSLYPNGGWVWKSTGFNSSNEASTSAVFRLQ